MNQGGDIKLHIFGEPTTMKNDYRTPPADYLKQYHLHKECSDLHDESENIIRRKRSLLCNESLTQLRSNVHVPFNLVWTTKPIVGHRKLQREIVEKPVDCGKEESIRTRPRLFLSPAVGIDDVTDKKKREMMLNYMYTTEFRNAEKATSKLRTLNKNKEKSACCCDSEEREKDEQYNCLINNAKCRIVAEEKDPIRVSTDMRRTHFKDWDDRQKRATVNPTTYFWNHTDIPKNIHIEDGLITPEMKQDISELTQRDKLRLPHDLPMTGYTAHKVELAYGVPMRRRDFPISHPMMTVPQAWYNRYEQDMEEYKNKRNST